MKIMKFIKSETMAQMNFPTINYTTQHTDLHKNKFQR